MTATAITATGATITWTTNEASDTQVQYGTTTAYGSSTTLNTTKVTAHAQALTGLTASTLYHYRVKSADAAGNLATSGDFTFTTSPPPDTTAPIITGISVGSITANSAVVTWTTNEASDSRVQYGTTTAYGSQTTLNATMVTTHSVALSGLTASTLYHLRVLSRDAAGNLATSTDVTFTTSAIPDTTPPVISAIAVSAITASGASISWTTNESSDSQVEYGLTASYGAVTAIDSAATTSHVQSLGGLATNTLYHYRVKSRDASGNIAISSDRTFTTAVQTSTVTAQSVQGEGGQPRCGLGTGLALVLSALLLLRQRSRP
ncbi:MAG: fibronectin type III domain-containing protein [Planctomycetes bacterium]|nr:fibronectin type III domain-containing protein [Planctomycetota bacterium]